LIEVRRTDDAGLIRRCMTHPRVWPWLCDDATADPAGFAPPIDDRLVYLAASDGADLGGVWFYHPHTAVCWEVHTACLPEWWGPRALDAARLTLRWMVGNTACRKVVTHVPFDNRPAHRFALRVGMADEGVNRASFLKGGDLLDQHALGITEKEILCLP
jgi:RimJ/RimL family protein N-acetyltransferase